MRHAVHVLPDVLIAAHQSADPDDAAVFPNPAALEGPAGAILAEHHDQWNVQDERRYLSEQSMAELYPTSPASERPTSLTPI